MAWVMFGKFIQSQFEAAPKGQIDFNSTDLRILLLTSAGAPVTATAEDVADMLAGSPVEVTGSNYARKALASEAVTISSVTVTIDASDPTAYSQHASGFSDARYAVLYVETSSDATTTLVAYYDLGANKSNKTGTLTLALSAAGIFTVA